MASQRTLYGLRDVDQVHLPAVAAVGRVDDDAAAVRTAPAVRVAPPFAFVLRRQVEPAQRRRLPGRNVVQVDLLLAGLILYHSYVLMKMRRGIEQGGLHRSGYDPLILRCDHVINMQSQNFERPSAET